jgi:hypothetical protein
MAPDLLCLTVMKKRSLLTVLLLGWGGVFAAAQDPPPAAPSGTIEAVEISGIPADRLSQTLRDDLQGLRGKPYNAEASAKLADRIQSELPEYVAAVRTVAGTQAGQVRVVFVVAQISESDALGENINARYPVESVLLEGVPQSQISTALWDEMQKMVGQPLNENEAGRLLMSLQTELGPRYEVSRKVRRGKPRQLTIVYEVVKTPILRWIGPRSLLAYHTKQGITAFGHLDGSATEDNVGTFHFRFGFGTNADELIERYKGFRFQVETQDIVAERLGFRFDLTTFGTIWKSQTELASEQSPEIPGIYRSRLGLEPSMAFAITPDLYVTGGFNFTGLEMQSAMETDWAQAGIGGLQYQRTFKSGEIQHQVAAGYTVHAAAKSIGSDFVYTSHYFEGRYIHRRKAALFKLDARGGLINGDAPLFERFSIGNTETARGWNKFDIAPLGTTRMFHTSLEAGHKAVRMFYDAGSVWDAGQGVKVRNSVGVTIGAGDKRGEGFLTIAAAIRNSRLEPTIMFRLWGR